MKNKKRYSPKSLQVSGNIFTFAIGKTTMVIHSDEQRLLLSTLLGLFLCPLKYWRLPSRTIKISSSG